jgi:NAD(P)-dependent dehydrogenase (short-subunit alcohol dehydrogenase family)
MTPQFQAAYNASKAGVTMLAKVCLVESQVMPAHTLTEGTSDWLQSLAAEWAPYGVIVNSVSPVRSSCFTPMRYSTSHTVMLK